MRERFEGPGSSRRSGFAPEDRDARRRSWLAAVVIDHHWPAENGSTVILSTRIVCEGFYTTSYDPGLTETKNAGESDCRQSPPPPGHTSIMIYGYSLIGIFPSHGQPIPYGR